MPSGLRPLSRFNEEFVRPFFPGRDGLAQFAAFPRLVNWGLQVSIDVLLRRSNRATYMALLQ